MMFTRMDLPMDILVDILMAPSQRQCGATGQMHFFWFLLFVLFFFQAITSYLQSNSISQFLKFYIPNLLDCNSLQSSSR